MYKEGLKEFIKAKLFQKFADCRNPRIINDFKCRTTNLVRIFQFSLFLIGILTMVRNL